MVTIGSLWTPAIWIPNLVEAQATFPVLFNSGVVTRTPLMDEIATGAGTAVNIPFFLDATDQADEIQVENTPPVNDNGLGGAVMIGTPLNRVTKNSVSALSGQVSGSDPMRQIINILAERRLKQRQSTLLSILRGVFGSAAANNIAAPLSGTRLLMNGANGLQEPFIENGLQATSDLLMSPNLFIQAKALMGELAETLEAGCFFVHPNVRARLEQLDALNFKTLIKPSELPFNITTYRGVPMFVSQALVRAGTGNGFVYDSYLIAKGVVGYGEKAQKGDVIDVASLQYFADRDPNNEHIWDRTRTILHLNGMKWVGNPAGQSATNAELQTIANWNLVFETPNRVGAVCIRTNG
jgi:hypothetical protein